MRPHAILSYLSPTIVGDRAPVWVDGTRNPSDGGSMEPWPGIGRRLSLADFTIGHQLGEERGQRLPQPSRGEQAITSIFGSDEHDIEIAGK